MPVSLVQRFLSVLMMGALVAAAQEPVKPKLNPRVVTATRSVTLFSGLELQLLKAVQKKDQPAVQALLTEDFTVEMPNADPLPGEDWVDSVMAKEFTLKSYAMREVSVVETGDAAVVKFERRQDAVYKGSPAGGEYFVVDVWKKTGESWKLANRFVSKTSSVATAAKTSVHPTGKQ
jgi:ketosteroid isomerase-like protein